MPKEVRMIRRCGPAAAIAVAVAAAAGAPAAQQAVTITPLLHSSVQIEGAGQVVQVDPWSKADLSRAKPADLILVTDDPIHHLDPAAIRGLRKPGASVLLPAASQAKFPEGTAIANGERRTINGITVEAIAAYDVKPGEPSHPKGKANGYLVAIAGQRIYLAGVTECVPEMQAQRNVDVAFVPMNLPLGRMTPAAAAECVNLFAPRAVYVYHYDQSWASSGTPMPNAAATLDAFRGALAKGIEYRSAAWYPR
jgi:L-ascorbate metabolism protein UlaG (beta-lactamase superfamily)